MKKLLTALTVFALAMGAAWTYAPPTQGENFFYLSHPELLTEGNSTAGGGIENIIPASGTINPALIGLEERTSLDLGYTMMFNRNPRDGFTGLVPFGNRLFYFDNYGASKVAYSQAFGTGVIIPTDWATFGGEMEFILDEKCMGLGDSFHIKSFASKQILDKLHVGVGLGFGYGWNIRAPLDFAWFWWPWRVEEKKNDWMLTIDAGAVYNFGDLGFLKNFRVAASANNIGKTLGTEMDWQGYPGMFNFRAGAAAEFLQTDKIVLGASLDVTTPLFMNLIIDSGVQVRICDFVQINSSWQFNAYEISMGTASWLPTLGVVFKFNIGLGDSDFVKKRDWSKSEICPSMGWKNVDGDVNMVSAGAVLRLGQKDRSGPDIEMD